MKRQPLTTLQHSRYRCRVMYFIRTICRFSVIDGEKIEYLDRHEMKKMEEDIEQEAENAKQDDYVLQKLFKKSGEFSLVLCTWFSYVSKLLPIIFVMITFLLTAGAVHSAMQHDRIMMSSNP